MFLTRSTGKQIAFCIQFHQWRKSSLWVLMGFGVNGVILLVSLFFFFSLLLPELLTSSSLHSMPLSSWPLHKWLKKLSYEFCHVKLTGFNFYLNHISCYAFRQGWVPSFACCWLAWSHRICTEILFQKVTVLVMSDILIWSELFQV